MPHMHAALLCMLTSILCVLMFDLRALFLCVEYAWQTYQYEKIKKCSSNDSATAPQAKAKRRRRVHKSGTEMAEMPQRIQKKQFKHMQRTTRGTRF